MIKRFYRSKSDIENLSRLRTSIPDGIDTFDYKRIVVNKPWGYEYLVHENAQTAVWALYLKPNQATSTHCHPNKKTSLLVISGEVVCSTLEGWLTRKAGEGVIIDEGVFHSTKAASPDGALIFEIESPPNKKDLVRLKDAYGREHEGYEGETHMSKHLSDYEYVDFHALGQTSKQSKKLRQCMICVTFHKNVKNIGTQIKREKADLLCLLQGKIHSNEGSVLLATGETASVKELQKQSRIYSFGDILYLTLTYGKHR